MVLCVGGTNTVTQPFFFGADKVPADIVAAAISDHFSASVVVEPGLASAEVSGRFVTADLNEAVQSLCFLMGARYRVQGAAYLIGKGGGSRRLVSFPSYGLQLGSAGGVFGQSVGAMGDRIVASLDDASATEIGTILQDMGRRRSLVLEVTVLDVSTNVIDRVNEWLDGLRMAAGAYKSNWMKGAPADAAATAVRRQGLVYDMDIKTVIELLDLGGRARIESREQVQVMSGSKSEFEAGRVVEDVTYRREEFTGKELVTAIERRVVGLTMTVLANHFGDGRWHLEFNVEDSAMLPDGSERRNRVTGQRLVNEGASWFLVSSLTRRAEVEAQRGVPMLRKVPLLKRASVKSVKQREDRQLMVLARPLGVTAP